MPQSIWPEHEKTGELLRNAQEGDTSAIGQLLDRHREPLRRMIQVRLDHKLGRRLDVSDVVQEVMVEASRRLKQYLDAPVMPFHLWIRQIAKDRMIDAHRRHRVSAKRSVDREQPGLVQGDADQSTLELAFQLRDPSLTPAAAASQREIAQQVELAVNQLDEIDREIIYMRHYELMTNQETARALELSEPAAGMRYLRALRRLRALIDQQISGSDENQL